MALYNDAYDDNSEFYGGGMPEPSTADPNAWLYDQSRTPTLVVPGQEWYWNGNQWTTRAAAPPPPTGTVTTGDGTVVPNPGPPDPYDPNDPHYDYGPGTLGGTVGVGPGGGGGGGTGGGGGYGEPPRGGNFPMFDAPSYIDDLGDYTPDPWNAPNPKDIYNDPSYEFRFEEGLRPIRNSRAAQGLTRTGATLKALQRYGQGFASNEYDRIYNRAADSYDRTQAARFGAHQVNRQARLDRYDRNFNEATAEFAPRQRWAELQFGRDWDIYKYMNDDAYRYYSADLDAASNNTQPPP